MKKSFVASAVVLILALVCFPLLPSLPLQTEGAESQTPITVPNDLSGEHETDVRIQAFFNALMKENSISVYEELFRQSLSTPTEVEQLSVQYRNRLAEVSVRFGGMVDYKKYDTQWIDEDIVLIRYILKYENSPMIWTFGFYRTPTTTMGITNDNPWRLIAAHFETDLRPLFLQ